MLQNIHGQNASRSLPTLFEQRSPDKEAANEQQDFS